MNGYYRGTRTGNPMSDWGHAMFTDNKDKAYFDNGSGNIGWFYDGTSGAKIESIQEKIAETWEEDKENGFLPIYYTYHDFDGETIAESFNPADIVDSAEAWDNEDLLPWIWGRVLEPLGIDAIITNDGAIVFEPSLIKRCE